jgi:membrane protein YdbS with pleckstrin-like domain
VTLPRKFLNEDEELLVEMRPHWVFFAKPLFTAVLVVAGIIAVLVGVPKIPNWATDVLLVVAAIPVLWLLGRLVRWRNYTLALTSTRIVVRRGVLGRNTTQLRLQRITEINLSQKLWERIVSTGRLLIDVQGEDDAVVLEFVQKPAVVQRAINGQINELCGGGSAEPIPAELRHIGARRRWSAPEPPPEAHTPPFGVPVVGSDREAGQAPRAAPSAPRTAPPTARQTAPPTARQGVVVPAPPGPVPAGSASPADIRDRLIELDDLRQRRIISEEEFAAKKAELLSRI